MLKNYLKQKGKSKTNSNEKSKLIYLIKTLNFSLFSDLLLMTL